MDHPRLSTERRRLVQPLWSALDQFLAPHLERGVVLAVSGGVDSRALLEAAARWKRRDDFLVVAVDHQTRPDAPREADAVAARARAVGFDAEIARVFPRGHGEAELRSARYAALADAARRSGRQVLVTAHHGDDDAEGLLLDVLGRGGGRAGAGMPPFRPERGLFVVRPFLRLRRPDLALALTGLCVTDSFADPLDLRRRGERARVRHQALPLLERVRPGVGERLAIVARRRAEDEAALEEAAQDLVSPESGGRLRVDTKSGRALIRRAVQEGIRQMAPGTDPRRASRTVDAVLDALDLADGRARRFPLPGGTAYVKRRELWLTPKDRFANAF